MIREIKFRAWVNIICHDLVLNEQPGTGSHWVSKFCMCEVLQLNISKNTMRVRWSIGNTADVAISNLMQFTEQVDPKNVDIYDGDILQHGQNIYIVQKREGNCNWLGVTKDGSNGMLLSFCSKDVVIGNIHQNPELLK